MFSIRKMIRKFFGKTNEWRNKEGQLHRVDGPAIEYANGTEYWYLNDQFHRVDGPAIKYADGSESWYFEGKLHRIDGPAVKGADGVEYWFFKEHCINCSSQEEFERLIKLKSFW